MRKRIFLKDSKILIVGGTGFIGRHLTNRCLRLGAYVVCIGVSTAKGIKTNLIKNPKILRVNIKNKDGLKNGLKGRHFEYVFNLGGYIDHLPYSKGGRELIEQHFTGTLNLVDSLDWKGLKGFVQIGSSDEYGNAPAPQHEGLREMPISPYSLGKVASTHYIQMLHRTEGFPGVVLRFFLVYGTGQDERRFLPQIIKGCLKDESFETTKGEQLRDFCYVDDVVDAMIKAAILHKSKGHVINVASGIPVSIRTMIEKVVNLIGKGNPIFGARPYRKGESMELYADIQKAKKLLDWEPTIELEEGLYKTIEWYSVSSVVNKRS